MHPLVAAQIVHFGICTASLAVLTYSTQVDRVESLFTILTAAVAHKFGELDALSDDVLSLHTTVIQQHFSFERLYVSCVHVFPNVVFFVSTIVNNVIQREVERLLRNSAELSVAIMFE